MKLIVNKISKNIQYFTYTSSFDQLNSIHIRIR